MTGEAVGIGAAVLVLAFGLGYGLGRRQGLHEGFAAGVGYGPLALRQVSWERGRCALCGAGPVDDTGAGAGGPPTADREGGTPTVCGQQDRGDGP